ncbi:MAG: hypothetical protein J0G96_12515 [Flavobacteriia bacterium]|nr:hypothetical protein [Flavobacteriia bacterium]OJX35922.1 MAG: hypothetical protein BGO87_05470 [Flavobacteriia bacterium 40-80]
MKKLFIIFVSALSLLISNETNAQAFGGKGSNHLLLGLGLNHHFTFFGSPINNNSYSSYGSLNVQYEAGIHDYVGIGIASGLEFSRDLGHGYYTYPGYYHGSGFTGLAIPVVFFGNFHFLQLINDKTGKNFAEKLDVYAGLSLGTGFSFAIPKRNNPADGAFGMMLIYGANVGVRYYFTPNIGVYTELGYGKTIAQAGVAFKL